MTFSESQSLYLSLTMEDEDLNSGGYRGVAMVSAETSSEKVRASLIYLRIM